MVWQFRWMIMVIFTVANIKIKSLDFKVKNVSDADKAYIDKNYRSILGKYIPLDWNSGKRHDCNETPDLEVREYRPSQELMKKNVM
jgi:hypothetical protein